MKRMSLLKTCSLFCVFFIAIIASCEKFPWTPEVGQVNVSFILVNEAKDLTYDFAMVESGKVFLMQGDATKVSGDLSIDKPNRTGDCTLINVPYGDYEIVVELYDSLSQIIYRAEDNVSIMTPDNGPKTIMLTRYTGTLVIDGSWTEDITGLAKASAELKLSGATEYGMSLFLDTGTKTVSGSIANIYPDTYDLSITVMNESGAAFFEGNRTIAIKQGANPAEITLLLKTGTIGIAVNGDVDAPVITGGPDASVSGTNVTITWTTDEPATSGVCYSLTPGFNYQSQVNWAPPGGDLTADNTSHSVTITGLTKDATCYYVVVTADADGNMRVSSEKSVVVTEYWVKTYGGSEDDAATRIVVDNASNIITAGSFHGTVDFDPGSGVDNQSAPTTSSIFVQKIDSDGELIWTNVIGSSTDDFFWRNMGLNVDSHDNIYFSSRFNTSVDFDPTTGTDINSPAGIYDQFWSKYGSDGSYKWTKRTGQNGISMDLISIGISTGDYKYLSGTFSGNVDFDPGAGTDYMSAPNGAITISRFDENDNYLSTLMLTETMAGCLNGYRIRIDASNNLYICGWYEYGIDLNPFEGVDNYTSSMGGNSFVTKLNADDTYGWSRVIGGSGVDKATDCALDSSGNVYVVSYITISYGGYSWMTIEKLNSSGSIIWTRSNQTADSNCSPRGIVLTGNYLYAAGGFDGTIDFDPTANTDNKTAAGSGTGIQDCYISKYDVDGNYYWTKTFGSTEDDTIISIAADSSGNIYLCGFFQGTVDFNLGTGTETLTSNGARDVFVMKIPESALE